VPLEACPKAGHSRAIGTTLGTIATLRENKAFELEDFHAELGAPRKYVY
jgi:hypothetical protein